MRPPSTLCTGEDKNIQHTVRYTELSPTRFKSSGALDRARTPLQSILSRPEVTAKRPRPLSPGQCRVHETGISMIADYVLQEGKRLGMRRVTSLDTAFVDDLFKKLLHKKEKDADDNEVLVERRTRHS